MKKRNKNVSSNIKNGTRIQTRDEYLDNTNYHSPGHSESNDLYRGAYVVDSNRDDELALVKLTTHRGRSPRGTTSEYINIFDNYGNPIKIDNIRFKVKPVRLSKKETEEIRKNLFTNSKTKRRNKYLVHRHLKRRQ